MRISTKFSLLVIALVITIAVASILIINLRMRVYLDDNQNEWIRNMMYAIAEGVARNTIDGNVIQTREYISRLVKRNNAVDYIYVTDFNGNLFAHSFDGGFPRYLVNKLDSHAHSKETNKIVNSYVTTKGAIKEYKHILIQGLDAHIYVGLNTKQINTLLNKANRDLLLILVFVGVIGLGVAIFTARRISKPIGQLTAWVDSFAQGGDVSSIELSSADVETRRLTSAFENMVISRLEAEEIVREREQNLSLTLNSIGDAVIATDKDGVITRMNPIAERLTGWSNDEARGLELEEVFKIINALTREKVISPVDKVFRYGKIVGLANHTVLIAKNGIEYQIADSAAPIIDINDKIYGVIMVFRDVTEEYELQTKLIESQQRLLLHRDQSPLGVIEWNTDFEVVEWNPAAERIFGYRRNEALGRTATELIVPENARKKVFDIWHELNHLKVSNRIANENITKQGNKLTCVWYNTPLINSKGDVIAVTSLVEDVTERKQTEEALRRSQKMDAIGKLSGGIAHDFNNQLGVIVGYLDMLELALADDSKTSSWIKTANKAAIRCMDLTRQLLSFSRDKGSETSIVDVNELLREYTTMVERSVTPQIDVEYILDNDLCLVELNPGEFQDAILNLIINAKDAMPRGGRLLIETKISNIDITEHATLPTIISGTYAQVIISDTGVGMDKQITERVFEPFFTTKPEGQGTGLGLAMVYGFVQRYKGYITLYSETGVGTTIKMYFPCSGQEAYEPLSGSVEETPVGTETVLIVDDEEELRTLAALYLTDLGYEVIIADDAEQALEELEKNKIDLLFTDVVMSRGINGYELANKATELKPGIKVLITSGYTSKNVVHDSEDDYRLIDKPYRKNKLARMVREVLDK